MAVGIDLDVTVDRAQIGTFCTEPVAKRPPNLRQQESVLPANRGVKCSELLDAKGSGYIKVHNVILSRADLKPAEKLALCLMLDYGGDKDDPCCFASKETLARRLGMKASGVKTLLTGLVRNGFLFAVDTPGRMTPSYYLVRPMFGLVTMSDPVGAPPPPVGAATPDPVGPTTSPRWSSNAPPLELQHKNLLGERLAVRGEEGEGAAAAPPPTPASPSGRKRQDPAAAAPPPGDAPHRFTECPFITKTATGLELDIPRLSDEHLSLVAAPGELWFYLQGDEFNKKLRWLPGHYREASLSWYPESLARVIRMWSATTKSSALLLTSKQVGCGKSCLATAAFKHHMERLRFSGFMWHVGGSDSNEITDPGLVYLDFAEFKEKVFSTSDAIAPGNVVVKFVKQRDVLLRHMTNAHLLFLDDVVCAEMGRNHGEVLSTVLQSRMDDGKKTIITTNLTWDQMGKKLNERTMSRLQLEYVFTVTPNRYRDDLAAKLADPEFKALTGTAAERREAILKARMAQTPEPTAEEKKAAALETAIDEALIYAKDAIDATVFAANTAAIRAKASEIFSDDKKHHADQTGEFAKYVRNL